MSNTADTVRSVMIPISDAHLLVPSAMVAEVLRLQEVKMQDTDSDQGQAQLNWRGQTVPLLSLEKLSGLPVATEESDPRIVVLYGLQEQLPFFALRSVSAPKILSVAANMLQAPEAVDDLPGLTAQLTVDEQAVYLPDIDYLQEAALVARCRPSRF